MCFRDGMLPGKELAGLVTSLCIYNAYGLYAVKYNDRGQVYIVLNFELSCQARNLKLYNNHNITIICRDN